MRAAGILADARSGVRGQTAADNARSRMKTNLEAKPGDDDLIEYYYIVLHPFTQSGFEYRRTSSKKFWTQSVVRLKERFGEGAPGLMRDETKKWGAV